MCELYEEPDTILMAAFCILKISLRGARARTRPNLDGIKKVAVENRVVEEKEAFLIECVFHHSESIQGFR